MPEYSPFKDNPFRKWLSEKYKHVVPLIIYGGLDPSVVNKNHNRFISVTLVLIPLAGFIQFLYSLFIYFHKENIESITFSFQTIVLIINIAFIIYFIFSLNFYFSHEIIPNDNLSHQLFGKSSSVNDQLSKIGLDSSEKIINATNRANKLISQFLRYIKLFWMYGLVLYLWMIVMNMSNKNDPNSLPTVYSKEFATTYVIPNTWGEVKIEGNASTDTLWSGSGIYYDSSIKKAGILEWKFKSKSNYTWNNKGPYSKLEFKSSGIVTLKSKKQNFKNLVFTIIQSFVNNIEVLMLLFAFYVLAYSSLEDNLEEDSSNFNKFKKRWYRRVIFLSVLNVAVIFVAYFLHLTHDTDISQNIELFDFIFKFISGLLNALIFCIFFARFEVRQFRTPILVLFVFYLYAIIQVLFPFFDMDFFGQEQLIGIVVPSILILCKSVFFIFLLYILEKERLFAYFMITKHLHAEVIDVFFPEEDSIFVNKNNQASDTSTPRNDYPE